MVLSTLILLARLGDDLSEDFGLWTSKKIIVHLGVTFERAVEH